MLMEEEIVTHAEMLMKEEMVSRSKWDSGELERWLKCQGLK